MLLYFLASEKFKQWFHPGSFTSGLYRFLCTYLVKGANQFVTSAQQAFFHIRQTAWDVSCQCGHRLLALKRILGHKTDIYSVSVLCCMTPLERASKESCSRPEKKVRKLFRLTLPIFGLCLVNVLFMEASSIYLLKLSRTKY